MSYTCLSALLVLIYFGNFHFNPPIVFISCFSSSGLTRKYPQPNFGIKKYSDKELEEN